MIMMNNFEGKKLKNNFRKNLSQTNDVVEKALLLRKRSIFVPDWVSIRNEIRRGKGVKNLAIFRKKD